MEDPTGALAGRNWFDHVFLRYQNHLAMAGPEVCLATATDALQVLSLAAVPYYARLRILEAGAAILSGRPGQGGTAFELLQYAEAASAAERALASHWQKNPGAAVVVDKTVIANAETGFWHDWLMWTHFAAAAQSVRAENELRQLQRRPLTPIQRRLVNCSRRYLEHVGDGRRQTANRESQ